MIQILVFLLSQINAKQGDFECIDDTKFKQFTSETSFVVNSCPPGLCATRNPKFKNPCIGRDRAAVIDGVESPIPSGQAIPAATPPAGQVGTTPIEPAGQGQATAAGQSNTPGTPKEGCDLPQNFDFPFCVEKRKRKAQQSSGQGLYFAYLDPTAGQSNTPPVAKEGCDLPQNFDFPFCVEKRKGKGQGAPAQGYSPDNLDSTNQRQIQNTSTPAGQAQSESIPDATRLAFLTTNANNFNDANIVPLSAPEIIPKIRVKSAAEGCKLAQNGFICVDLARNVRCVNGVVSKNFVKPFSANDLIKSCVGGFCGGSVPGQSPSGNKCVGTPQQAIDGNNNGNEFFLPPP